MFVSFILGCSSQDNTKSESFQDLEGVEAEGEIAEPIPVLVITYPVESLSKWKKTFESLKKDRESIGIFDLGSLVTYENRREVSVFLKMPSHQQSEQYANSEEFRESLKLLGVVGEPQIILMDALKLPEKPATQKYRMMITHEVREYDHWKSIFDQYEAPRRDAGLELIGIGRSVENERMISVMFAFDDMDAARIFARSEDLKKAMEESGVISDPILAWYEKPSDN